MLSSGWTASPLMPLLYQQSVNVTNLFFITTGTLPPKWDNLLSVGHKDNICFGQFRRGGLTYILRKLPNIFLKFKLDITKNAMERIRG